MTIGRVINTVNGVATEKLLLTADEGMELVSPDGKRRNCVAAESADGWTEVRRELDEEAEAADYIAALAELGVAE